MQLITAVIKPHVVDGVKDALKAKGVTGMTINEVRGFGRQGGHTETYRGTEYTVDFLPKIMVQVVTESSAVDDVIEVISSASRTGKIGDGKIWVTDVARLVRIRTGEEGPDAI